MTCNAENIQWFKVIESGKQSLNSTGRTYTINVTTVMEFGGQIYECECENGNKCFMVWGEYFYNGV